MKLFDGGRAPNPRRVSMFIAEKGIEIERVPVDMAAMGHREADVSERNPLQRLPVLELDDGTILTESVAICRYLESLHPDPLLFGSGHLEQAQVEMWNRRVELIFLSAVAHAFRHTHRAMKEWEVPQLPEWGEINRPKALKFLEFLDSELADRRFIVNDRFSIADITAVIAFDFMKPAKIPKPDHLVHVARWFEEVSSRPSYQA